MFLTSCGTTDGVKAKPDIVQPIKTDVSKLPTISYPQTSEEIENPTTIDLKSLKEGEIIDVEFAIKNIGDKPLIIRNAVTGCGCTSVTYERKPIKPGETTVAKLKFDSKGQWGPQLKTIEIISTDKKTTFIKLKADVS